MSNSGLATSSQIGVGPGGSCPECRTPLDLGQDYCLECGANIHTRKQRVKRLQAVPGGASATIANHAPPGKRGFPWVWFTVVLVVVLAALVSLLVYESSGSSASQKDKPSASTTEQSTTSSSDPSANGGTNTTPSPSFPTSPNSGQNSTLPGDMQGQSQNGQTSAANGTGSTFPTQTQTTTSPTSNATFPSTPVHTNTTPANTGTSAGVPVNKQPTMPQTPAPTTGTNTSTTTNTTTTWPAGSTGYTVVLGSYGKSLYTETEADQRAQQASQHGLTVGVLDSDLYSSLNPGYWVVFSGNYATQAQAQAQVAACVKAGYVSAYVKQVKP